MPSSKWYGRSIVLAVVGLLMTLLAPAAQAEHEHGSYYFEQDSSQCGNIAPVNPVVDAWSRGDRDYISIEFTITEQQIAAWGCSGSHFDLYVNLAGFSPRIDWSHCSIGIDHEFTFGWEVIDNGRGAATAAVYGAKMTDNRMYPGYVYEVELECSELRFSRHSVPTISVEYVGAWYSIDPSAGTLTPFETDETEINPGGLPVYVEYTGQNAWLVNSDGDWELPLYP